MPALTDTRVSRVGKRARMNVMPRTIETVGHGP